MGTSSSKSTTSTYPGQRTARHNGTSSSAGGAGSGGHNRTQSTPAPNGAGGAGGRGGHNRTRSNPPAAAAPPPPPQQPQPPPAAQTHSGPGAFSVDPSTGPTSVYRVNVPDGVRPGQEFQVYAGTRLVRVRCPPNIRPGHSLQITVPAEPTVTRSVGIPQMVSSATASSDAPVETPAALRDQQLRLSRGADGSYMVTIPPGVEAGEQFPLTIEGQQLIVTCPNNARPGMTVRIAPPAPPPGGGGGGAGGVTRGIQHGTSLDRPPPPPQQRPRPPERQPDPSGPTTQMFEVVVPGGVRPGQPFALMAGGQRVLVTCPANAGPGQKIRFQLPINLAGGAGAGGGPGGGGGRQSRGGSVEAVRLSYDKDGWTRTIRVSDMKFQWVRMDDKGDVDLSKRFDVKTSAYVRKLDFLAGVDPRMRGGNLSLVPATEAVVDSVVRGPDGREIVSYGDIARAQIQSFQDKSEWFHETCRRLCVEWEEGHMRVNVRRDYLLNDSMMAIMSLSRKDLRKIWKFEFIGEKGIDAGGLAREWFQLVTEEIFNPDNGLWRNSNVNQMCMEINPASEMLEDYLVYFRFLGRVIGKALFDNQVVPAHMIRHLYKHLLGWPITFEDLEMVDEDIYSSLKQTAEIEDVEMLCLDFTTTEDNLGVKKEIELVKGGSEIDVTDENLPEYLECCLKYRLLGRVKPQLTELLLGFFDVLPEPMLTVFDFQELELLMCGMPTIDVDDWKTNTEYTGEYSRAGLHHQVVRWFWEVVDEFDQERKARLLQFVTGTSGVPSMGFAGLQGDGGGIRKFTVHGVKLGDRGICYPRAHTCFNRIDFPVYPSKAEVHDKLKIALEMAATGFDID